MKRIILIALAIVCGVACTDCFAKKPKKEKLTNEEIVAKIDSLKREREKSMLERELDKGGRWDKPVKLVHYYCLRDYFLEYHPEMLELEEEQAMLRFKIYELCGDKISRDKPFDWNNYLFAYAMHADADSATCMRITINEAVNYIYDIISNRLSPTFFIYEIYLNPNEKDSLTCSNWWEKNLTKVSRPQMKVRFGSREFANQLYSIIRSQALICEDITEIDKNDYRGYVAIQMPVRTIVEWLETLAEGEQDENWARVITELLYKPIDESKVVVGHVHYAL